MKFNPIINIYFTNLFIFETKSMWHKSNIFSSFFSFSTLLASLLWVVVLNYNLIWEGHARTSSAKVRMGVFSIARLFGAFHRVKIWWVVKVQIWQIVGIGGPSLPVTCRSDWGLGGRETETPFVSIYILLRLLLSCLFWSDGKVS
jgi:hypothetical protein